MNALDAMNEQVATHRVDEFYAWNDFKSDFRDLKLAGCDFLDGLDDFGADLDSALSGLDEADFSAVEESLVPDLSRYELRRQEWQ